MLAENTSVFVVAFDGPHRVGKGQNIMLLGQYLLGKGVPHVVLRGDGTRPGRGNNDGDPFSPYWQEFSSKLRDPATPKGLWDYAAYILSKELLIWKNIYMPRRLDDCGGERGMIILDRSILSRTLITREQINTSLWEEMVSEALYKKPNGWKGKQLKIDDLAPNLIFSLHAPLDVLLGRLDKNDPKYEFRRRNLVQRCDWYTDAINYIPDRLKSLVVPVDTNRPPEEVFGEVKTVVEERLGI